ncbi:MAG: DUF2177 family protein [Anaerolineae bacterium]|nr:DUF2177 family protein [Anaerolineae bacterium]
MKIVWHYVITFVVFMIIDLVWLAVIAKNLYQSQIGHLMKSNPNWFAAGLFYLLFIVGVLFFVVEPALAKVSWRDALLVGFVFGFMCYMTYDLTNLATMRDWPVLLTVIDIVWGTALCGVTSLVSYLLIRLLVKG